jgi:tetratricopeptide (TPR) repeat protein
LASDREYAAEMLRHLDRLRGVAGDDPDFRLGVDSLRLIALHTLRRREEMRAVVDRMLEQRPREGEIYYGPLIAAFQLEDQALAVRVWEVASESVPGVERTALRQLVHPQVVWMLFGELHDNKSLRTRLAEALFRIGWPGDNDQIGADSIRLMLVDDYLERGDLEGARGFAATLATPETLRRLLVQLRYDAIVAPGIDRLAVLREALTQRERETAESLRLAPRDAKTAFDRAQLLRLLGRNDEAWAVLEPFSSNVAETVASDFYGLWIINVAADALAALRRDDEAIRLMRQLAELPLADNLDLIGPNINFAEMLLRMGRPEEALRHAIWLDSEQRQHANVYGQMWIDSALVCALARLDRRPEALQRLERMSRQGDSNRSALARAHLCVGQDEAAEALLVRQLGEENPGSVLLQLQDYSIEGERSDEVDARLLALRDRPRVRSAIERVGRILQLPVADAPVY